MLRFYSYYNGNDNPFFHFYFYYYFMFLFLWTLRWESGVARDLP